MAGNQLSGTIPTSWYFWNLKKLNLAANKLTSTLPPGLPSVLPSVEMMALGYNQLNGTIPAGEHAR